MKPVLGVLHTAVGNVTLFQGLCRELLPGVDAFQMLDESLLRNTITAGALTPETTRRVLGHVELSPATLRAVGIIDAIAICLVVPLAVGAMDVYSLVRQR